MVPSAAIPRKVPEEQPSGEGGLETAGTPGPEGDRPVPFVKEVKQFVRNLVVAEKNCELYPMEGKVVQGSLEKLLASFLAWEEAAGTQLDLQVSQFELSHDGVVVYHEEQRERSLAYVMHKDLVWAVRFLPGLTVQELSSFLSCFREARSAGDQDDDFSSLFWEKDFQHIHVETADEFSGEEEVLEVTDLPRLEEVLDPERFRIPAEKEMDLLKEAAQRERDFAAGKFSFQLSHEELDRILQLKADGENSSSLGNFLDLLFDFLTASPDPSLLQVADRAVRTVFSGLMRSMDLESARVVLEKLSERSRRDPTSPIRFWLKEVLQALWDKPTQRALSAFLKKEPALDPGHQVFKLMKALDPAAVPSLIDFLKIHQQSRGVSEVLVHLGKGCRELFPRYLHDPDPQLVRSLVQVLLTLDPGCADSIAGALKHPEAPVRLEVAKILWTMKDARVGESFVGLLEEKSRECLQGALEFLAETACPAAFRKLVSLVRSTGFDQLDKPHQRLCFQALYRADPPRAVPFIARTLRPWWFDFARDSVLRKEAAILALSAFPADPRAEALLRATSRRGGWQASMARQVLLEWKRPRPTAVEEAPGDDPPED